MFMALKKNITMTNKRMKKFSREVLQKIKREFINKMYTIWNREFTGWAS